MLRPFKVLKDENEPSVESFDYTILVNTEHITTLKPINIPFAGDIIAGHWIRLLNGKTYKATRIPQDLKNLLNCEEGLASLSLNGESVASEQPFQ